jgi:hypothetical protein
LILFVQYPERHNHWEWMLSQPDQTRTFAALHRLGDVARAEGITQAQLMRIIDPAWRAWNAAVLHDTPAAFPLVMMVVDAPQQVARPLTDTEARSRLRARLTPLERNMLGSGTCVLLYPTRLPPDARTVSVGRRVDVHEVAEFEAGRYRAASARSSYVEFEFDPAAGGRFVALPGLESDQDIVVCWHEGQGPWRPAQTVRLLRPRRSDEPAVIELERLIHFSGAPVRAIRIAFTHPGVLEISGAPRLVR